ncbi:TPA: hypothetical protein N3A33_000220 [Salmonella enterica subsp. salamae serovar 28:r:e,n,z15]|nr:hypothetical protein [Salmonella enterica subsp. salamae serovar 28:r:e,n,z15]
MFQMHSRGNTHRQGVKETIVDMALNGSGVRYAVRSINTVLTQNMLPVER